MAGKYSLQAAHNHDQVYAKIGESGVTDHGALTGLEDDDHPQYLLTTGKAADSDKLDGLDSTAFAAAGHDHDTDYLGITAKAADSDKLDGLDSTAFGRPVFLTAPFGSTSWDGDARSTTSKTLIDLSAVFGVPAGVKAVLARIAARDSGSSFDAYFGISPNDVPADLTVNIRLQGHADDQILEMTSVCPCNADGDVYYQTKASGSGTLDCWLWIWGYWL